MLTALNINEGAVGFYRKLGYRTDPDSPAEEQCPYVILRKVLST